jgi:hypothetical protein
MKGGPVTWEGKTRPVLTNQDVVPHLESGPFPVWIAVGGNLQSVIRAARYGFSLMLAIIGGSPARFAPFSQLFREALESSGRAPCRSECRRPATSPQPDEKAQEEFWPRYLQIIRDVSETRGFAVPTEESFSWEIGPQGALYVGAPETVAQKIARNLVELEANRFDLKYRMGGLPHEALMTNIELYGTQVVPRVARSSPRIVPRRQILDWIRSRSGHALRRGASQKAASRNRAGGSHVQTVRSAPDLSDEGVTRFGGRFAFSAPGRCVPVRVRDRGLLPGRALHCRRDTGT